MSSDDGDWIDGITHCTPMIEGSTRNSLPMSASQVWESYNVVLHRGGYHIEGKRHDMVRGLRQGADCVGEMRGIARGGTQIKEVIANHETLLHSSSARVLSSRYSITHKEELAK